MARRIDRNYYVSWVAVANDPWPGWDRDAGQNGGPLLFRDADDPQWPGVPERAEGDRRLIDTGPTLATLFHPRSRFCDLQGLDRVYLLYEPRPGKQSPHERLWEAMERIAEARNSGGEVVKLDKVELVPIDGINTPTDHVQIVRALEAWIDGESDPFSFGKKVRKGKEPRRITINLSPGTPAMHACWLMLKWNGTLRNPPGTHVDYIQGDGGVRAGTYREDEDRDPIRAVPFDELSKLIDKEPAKPSPAEAAPTDEVNLGDLIAPVYVDLRRSIEQAAGLGVPILLEGHRGTGKTHLAKYYHERRQFYRRHATQAEKPSESSSLKVPTSRGQFVAVSLSEYDQVQELRDTLFGWAAGSWTGADKDKHHYGLLGDAHQGTLFLDEIHHLSRALQALLLGPMNVGHYRPKMADWEVRSDFDLVVATNREDWESHLADDFCDRIKRIVLHVPSFSDVRRLDPTCADLWRFWEFTIRRRCRECGVAYEEPTAECGDKLTGLFQHAQLPGNWRDLHRLADQVLLHQVDVRGGRPTPLMWDPTRLNEAITKAIH